MTHYLLVVIHEAQGQHHICFHNFQAASEDAAWETVDRYLTSKGITTIVRSALEGFPTVEAMGKALNDSVRTLLAGGAQPKRVNVNVTLLPSPN